MQNLCFQQELFPAYRQTGLLDYQFPFQLHFLPVGLQVTLAQGGKPTGKQAPKEAVSESNCLHSIFCLHFFPLIFFLLILSMGALEHP